MLHPKLRDPGWRRLPSHEAKKEAALAAAHHVLRMMAVRLDVWRIQSRAAWNDPDKADAAEEIVEAVLLMQAEFDDVVPIRCAADGTPLDLGGPPTLPPAA